MYDYHILQATKTLTFILNYCKINKINQGKWIISLQYFGFAARPFNWSGTCLLNVSMVKTKQALFSFCAPHTVSAPIPES